MPNAVVTRPGTERAAPPVPVWGLAVGIVLVLAFAGLVVQTYVGRSIRSYVGALLPGGGTEQMENADAVRVWYVAGDTVRAGQVGIGSRGQDRTFQAGDLVLLGAAGRLVRIGEGGRLTELRADEGTTPSVQGLGAWDSAAGTLGGARARFVRGAWTVEAPALPPVGAPLSVSGAPDDELTADFQLMPGTAGRIRRFEGSAGSGVRLRPTGRTASLLLEGWQPLPTLDNATVTVRAVVRASEGASVELALSDVLDAAGTIQRTVDARSAPDEDAWMTLRVQRRVTFGSPNDRYSVGLVDVRNRDWLEVRDLAVYLGTLP
jgi:hypothetical protein